MEWEKNQVCSFNDQFYQYLGNDESEEPEETPEPFPYEKGRSEEYYLDLLNRYKDGELWSEDSIRRPADQKFATLKYKRPVYGGGGIIPDLFVPADTSYFSTYYRDLVAKGIIHRITTRYVDANRASLLKQYPDNDAYQASFTVPEELDKNIFAAGDEAGVPYKEEDWQRSAPLVNAIIKGIIANDLYEDGSYYRPISLINKDFEAALKLINDPGRYNALLTGKAE